VYTKALTP